MFDVLGGEAVLTRAGRLGPPIRRVGVDRGCRGRANWARWPLRRVAQVARRRDRDRGSEAPPRRWVAERALTGREALIHVAVTRVTTRRRYPA